MLSLEQNFLFTLADSRLHSDKGFRQITHFIVTNNTHWLRVVASTYRLGRLRETSHWPRNTTSEQECQQAGNHKKGQRQPKKLSIQTRKGCQDLFDWHLQHGSHVFLFWCYSYDQTHHVTRFPDFP